jgi:hypothetical protein
MKGLKYWWSKKWGEGKGGVGTEYEMLQLALFCLNLTLWL